MTIVTKKKTRLGSRVFQQSLIILERAKEILRNLEESELTPEGNVRQSARHRAERDKLKQLAPPPQMDLFG